MTAAELGVQWAFPTSIVTDMGGLTKLEIFTLGAMVGLLASWTDADAAKFRELSNTERAGMIANHALLTARAQLDALAKETP